MKTPLKAHRLCILLFVSCVMVLLGTQPLLAGRTKTRVEKSVCQTQGSTRPAPAIYNDLEGVLLLISAPFIERDAPYASILSKESLVDIFRESIVKNVLPYVKPSGGDCSIPPAFYEYYSADFQDPKKRAEIDAITDNPKVVTIHIQVSRLQIDEHKNRQAAAIVFNIHRAGFKSELSAVGISVVDLNRSLSEISERMSRFRESKYFLTTYK